MVATGKGAGPRRATQELRTATMSVAPGNEATRAEQLDDNTAVVTAQAKYQEKGHGK